MPDPDADLLAAARGPEEDPVPVRRGDRPANVHERTGNALRSATARQPLLVEAAWEACNPIGGIYTVLRTKVQTMQTKWGNRYCLAGPYDQVHALREFESDEGASPFRPAVEAMRAAGYRVELGRWLVAGRPWIVLLHRSDAQRYLGDVKARLWRDHQIPTPDDELIDGVVAFGECLRVFLSFLTQSGATAEQPLAPEEADAARAAGEHGAGPGDHEASPSGRAVVAQIHEWMAAPCIPMLRQESWPGTFVFTTHATVLGRYLAMNDPTFYDHLPFYDAGAEATKFNVASQHGIERAAAHGSQVFTTVSDITALECRHLLGRDVDHVLPNGINTERFAAIHQFQHLHDEYKNRIHEFTIGHFFPSYTFDLDKTLYLFTSGRYEYRNKGMDLTIEALARLNHRLKAEGSGVTVVFFLITRAATRSISVASLKGCSYVDDFRRTIARYERQIAERLFMEATRGGTTDLNTLVDDYSKLRLRRLQQEWKRSGLPSVVTHDLVDPGRDPVLDQLHRCHLHNAQEDPVKVVFHPDFISGTSPLFGMDYDQFVRGCHLGVFPSYYEPWGYTPLESIALGVPAITSDLAGFGSYVAQHMPAQRHGGAEGGTAGVPEGVSIVPRRGTDPNHSAEVLTEEMLRFCRLDRRGRITQRNAVEDFAQDFDWRQLAAHYEEAYATAIERL
ncbi:glycosyltransferase [Phycisphaera mikurensis]|uniref:glycosyltransferase n=1 Tax=Phycisphaera mikurensis TaxID=547188 RepID=UPI000A00D09C|nr:glycosyltransferase [Phycisphaera mikurensis]MBB6442660.1 glycogen(starch) synthase [Phycisphaera mikurensis]